MVLLKTGWEKILNYEEARKRFKHWSHKIKGEGDGEIEKGSPIRDWKKVIALKPIGGKFTHFRIGFETYSGEVRISNVERRVDQGIFGMRMGPEDCSFFAASNEGIVYFRSGGYTNLEKAEMDIY